MEAPIMLDNNPRYIKIFQKIRQANNILLVGHKGPDGDCLGAVCALGCYLDSIEKKYTSFNLNEIPESFNYLSCAEKITNDLEKIQASIDKRVHTTPNPSSERSENDSSHFQGEAEGDYGESPSREKNGFDLIIVIDTSSLDHTGIEPYLQKVKEKSFLINIDHHISNDYFGHLNLVVNTASSTSEIIFDLFRNNKIFIDKKIANSLLTGIISDSGGFSNAATTISSINAASYLLIRGGRLLKIVKKTCQNQSLSSLKLWGKILSRLEKNKKYNIAYTYITLKDMEENNIDEENISGIANFLNNLEGSKAMFFIKEKTSGEISVSMRTTDDLIDVAKLAKIVGGGGHKKAAGFSINGKIIEKDGEVNVI